MLIPLIIKGTASFELFAKIIFCGLLTIASVGTLIQILYRNKYLTVIATVIYLLLPSRLLLLAIDGNLRRSLTLALLPLLLLSILAAAKKVVTPLFSHIPEYVCYLCILLFLLLIDFMDPIDGMIVTCLTIFGLLICLFRRKKALRILLSVIVSIPFGMLWNYRFWKYIFWDAPYEGIAQLHSLIPTGYHISDFLMLWTTRAIQPGLGAGLLLGLGLAIWFTWVEPDWNKSTTDQYPGHGLLMIGLMTLLLSMRLPLWDFAMRTLPFMTRLISAIDQLRYVTGIGYCFLLFGLLPVYKNFLEKSRKEWAMVGSILLLLLSVMSSVVYLRFL